MELPFMPHYGRDFLAKTARLDRTLKSVYMDLRWYMWERGDETGSPTLPDDPETISILLGCSEDEWAEWRSVLTKGKTAAFITAENGELSDRQLTEEFSKAVGFHTNKSRAGKKGAKARWNNGTAIANDGTAIAQPCDRIATAMANDGYSHAQSQSHADSQRVVEKGESEGEKAEKPEPEPLAADAAPPANSDSKQAPKGKKAKPGKVMPEECPRYTDLYHDEVTKKRPGTQRADALVEWQRWHAHHRAKGDVIKDFRASWRTWVLSPYWRGSHLNGSDRPEHDDIPPEMINVIAAQKEREFRIRAGLYVPPEVLA